MVGEGIGTAKRRRVLLVDDDTRILNFLTLDFRAAGYGVLTCTSGREALRLVESDPPDVMMLDLIMPGMDGFEVLRKLREFSQLPVIACSTDDSSASRAIEHGATRFIPKPIDLDRLVTTLAEVLGLPQGKD